MHALELKIPPVVQVFVVAGLMWISAAMVPSLGFKLPISSVLALALTSIGVIFVLLGVLKFRSAGTTVDPRFPDQSVSLVVGGVYRISRNPMYVGFLLVLLAWGFFLSNIACFVLLPVFIIYMNRFQILPEERQMRKKFGDAYRQYEALVRRWL